MSKVSVVIPTVGRRELRQALDSALNQTSPVHEVIVVADTRDKLELPEDPRVRLLRVGPGAGGNVARQEGILQAEGDLIALLDDDDEWLPNKLEAQLDLVEAARSHTSDWIAACQVEAKGLPGGTAIWPERTMDPSDGLVDYLFRKTKLRGGSGFMQSSCLLFPRELAIRVPFDRGLRFHQDIAWLVDVAHSTPNLRVYQAKAPLSVYNVPLGTGSVSQKISPSASIDWAKNRLMQDGQRILGDFILTHTLVLARRASSMRSFLHVVRVAITCGRPGLPALGFAVVTGLRIAASKSRSVTRSS